MCFDKHVLTGDRILLTLLQAGTMDWEASGKQSVNEEEQAAAKAAAKQAKKLRHKLNKQPMQQDHSIGQTALCSAALMLKLLMHTMMLPSMC